MKRLREFEFVLFDLDGTLWDSEKAFVETLRIILKESYGIRMQRRTIKRKLERINPIQLLKDFDIYSGNIFWREYKKNYFLVKLFFDNTGLILQELIKTGKKLGVVTSLRKSATIDLLTRFDLKTFMSIIITPSETRARKPSPIPIQKALNALRANCKKTIYIGDNDDDIIAAREAGCSSGLVGWGKKKPYFEKPDHVFFSIDELLN